MPEIPRSVAVPTGFLMVLRQGDDVFDALASLMRTEEIPSAVITGFGFAARATFGFFDFERADYEPRTFQDLEVTSLTGTLAWMDGEPSIHAHAAGADRSFLAVGGHVLALEVGRGSFEIGIVVHPLRLERAVEPDIGAKVLQLPGR